MKSRLFISHLKRNKVLALCLTALFICSSLSLALGQSYEGSSISVQMPMNPHASPPGPNTPLPDGIVGLALHVTAARIGDPAQLIIRAVHPSGPAGRAGLNHGEEVFEVNGEPVTGKTYQEVIGLIRGEVGSSVKLGLRGPRGEQTVNLVRVSQERLMEQTPPSL